MPVNCAKRFVPHIPAMAARGPELVTRRKCIAKELCILAGSCKRELNSSDENKLIRCRTVISIKKVLCA
jgi:hypothetical protein